MAAVRPEHRSCRWIQTAHRKGRPRPGHSTRSSAFNGCHWLMPNHLNTSALSGKNWGWPPIHGYFGGNLSFSTSGFWFCTFTIEKRAAGPLGINLCNKLQQTWASNVHVMRSTAIMVSVCLKIMYNPSQILWFINVYHIPWHGHMICPIFSLFSGTKVQLDETSAELPSTGRTWQQWALLKRPLHEVLAVAFPTTPGWDQEVGCSQ